MRKTSYKYFLLPFSFLYGSGVRLRNYFFDRKIFRSAKFDLPVICVGNLSAGGTGKSPMVEYLIKILYKKYNVATLSRGYKRKTKGFYIAHENIKTSEIGDEPMQFFRKFPGITVAVDEDRVMGIPKILNDEPKTEVVILDDAFQHRQVSAGLNILLTGCDHLYTDDLFLPSGNLRDAKKSSERADVIVVTKCSAHLSLNEREIIIKKINPGPHQKIFFTTIQYEPPYHLFKKEKMDLDKKTEVLLVCGIADPKKIKNEIESRAILFNTLRFKDHHTYHSFDIKKIKDEFSKMPSAQKIILTTEKDATRFLEFENELKELPMYVLGMKHQFLFDQEINFKNEIIEFIDSFDKNNEVEI